MSIEEVSYPVQELAQGKSIITPEQQNRLDALDWFIDELGIVMQENKEYGILQAQWRHTARFEEWLYTGTIKPELDNNTQEGIR